MNIRVFTTDMHSKKDYSLDNSFSGFASIVVVAAIVKDVRSYLGE
jgi:hypothetical protein